MASNVHTYFSLSYIRLISPKHIADRGVLHGKSNRQDHWKPNSCKIAAIRFEPFSDNRLQRSIANNTALTRITVSCDSGIETKRGTMKLQQLIYAVKVAECGSITEASRKLFVSQPSITAAISDLEKEM
ncbi:MAG: LysR family transcriptional regulator, partial [Eggerthellaceae bacterium]